MSTDAPGLRAASPYALAAVANLPAISSSLPRCQCTCACSGARVMAMSIAASDSSVRPSSRSASLMFEKTV